MNTDQCLKSNPVVVHQYIHIILSFLHWFLTPMPCTHSLPTMYPISSHILVSSNILFIWKSEKCNVQVHYELTGCYSGWMKSIRTSIKSLITLGCISSRIPSLVHNFFHGRFHEQSKSPITFKIDTTLQKWESAEVYYLSLLISSYILFF